jgi:sporulation protein YlmC with PRC-barrel domain
MAIVTQENINRWIEQSDIDYIGHYIKAWIPFNAWYNNTFQTLNTDREKINEIKKNPNTVRNAINSLMEGDSALSMEFKSHLASLIFYTGELNIQGRDGVINFENIIKVKNAINQKNEDFGLNKYFVLRTDGNSIGQVTQIQINIKRKSNNSSIFNYTHTSYDLEHLQNFPAYQSLSDQVKTQIRIYYQELIPFSTESIIENNLKDTPINYYRCDNFNLRRDTSNTTCYAHLIVKALIEILYQLRNVVFHGELVPNRDAQKVYAAAFHVLKIILEKIK